LKRRLHRTLPRSIQTRRAPSEMGPRLTESEPDRRRPEMELAMSGKKRPLFAAPGWARRRINLFGLGNRVLLEGNRGLRQRAAIQHGTGVHRNQGLAQDAVCISPTALVNRVASVTWQGAGPAASTV